MISRRICFIVAISEVARRSHRVVGDVLTQDERASIHRDNYLFAVKG